MLVSNLFLCVVSDVPSLADVLLVVLFDEPLHFGQSLLLLLLKLSAQTPLLFLRKRHGTPVDHLAGGLERRREFLEIFIFVVVDVYKFVTHAEPFLRR